MLFPCGTDKYKLAVNQSQIYVKFLFSNVLTILYPAIPDDALCNFSPLEAMIANLYLQPDISEIIRIVKEVSKPVLDSFSAGTDTMRKEVACAISYIANHYSEDLSAEVLASAVYLTPDYLSRLFKKATGKSISQYIRQYRMEKAKKYELAAVFNIVKALFNFLNHRVCSCLYFSGELPKYSRKL